MPRSNVMKQSFAGIKKAALTRLGSTKNELVKAHRELSDLVTKAKERYEVFEEKVYQTTQMLEADWRSGNPGLNKPMDPPLFTGNY